MNAAKLRVVLASKFTQMDRENVTLIRRSSNWAKRFGCRPRACSSRKPSTPSARSAGYAIETETRQNRERLNQIAIEGVVGKARIRTNEEAAPS